MNHTRSHTGNTLQKNQIWLNRRHSALLPCSSSLPIGIDPTANRPIEPIFDNSITSILEARAEDNGRDNNDGIDKDVVDDGTIVDETVAKVVIEGSHQKETY